MIPQPVQEQLTLDEETESFHDWMLRTRRECLEGRDLGDETEFAGRSAPEYAPRPTAGLSTPLAVGSHQNEQARRHISPVNSVSASNRLTEE